MALYTKSILAPKQESDGIRISVMSRHTKNDGVTPDDRITPDLWDKWKQELGPPLKVIGAYYKRGLPWEEFERAYIAYLMTPDIRVQVKNLAREATQTDITIMCIEPTPERCHRRLLAQECQRLEPRLQVVYR